MAENTSELKSSSEPNLMAEAYYGTSEETFFRSPNVPSSFRPPYNSDDIWQKTGSYETYEEMLKDDQVSVCLQLKKDLIIGAGFDIVPQDEDQQEIADEISESLNDDSDFNLIDAIEEICTAYEFGFSITEKIFKICDDGKLAIKDLKTRHPNTWLLYQDDKGNISKYVQRVFKQDIEVNPKSLIHLINNSRFQNPYGSSDLRAAYNAWFAKRQIVRYFAIFLDKAKSAIPVARYTKDAPQSAVTKIHDIIQKFQTKTAITIPKEIEIDFLEAKSNGEAYTKAINLFNMFIGRGLFVPDLLGLTGSETGGGSLALGKEQINIFFMHIIRRRNALEKLINKHLIKPLVLFNYGDVKNYPKFKFKPLDDSQAGELAKVWLDAVKGKVYQPNEEEINHFRKLVKFPEGEVVIDGQEGDPEDAQEQTQENMPGMEKENPEMDDKQKMPANEDKKISKFGKAFNQVSGDYFRKTNFKAIETKLDDYDQSITNETAPIIQKIFNDIADQIDKKKIIQSQNLDRISSIKIKNLKELKQSLKSSFVGLYKDAQSQASQEILKSTFKKPITDDKFLEIIENEVYSFIGDWEYKISQLVRNQLIAGIKDGSSLSNVIDVLDNEGKKLGQDSIDRFARTKHTEVLNKGRLEFFNSSGVVAAYQYSAILDDRTSDICRGLHGKIFKAGTEPVPPMHFNCRSVLIPITKYEEFTPSEKVGKQNIEDFIEENKGTGFSTK